MRRKIEHRPSQQRESGSVVPTADDQPNAHGVAPGHEPVTVVLDLVNPVRARGGLVGRGWDAHGSTKPATVARSVRKDREDMTER